MIWADHVPRSDPDPAGLLGIGAGRRSFDVEVLDSIERLGFVGSGVAYVDTRLLVSTRLTPDAKIWTPGRGLRGVAAGLGVAAEGI